MENGGAIIKTVKSFAIKLIDNSKKFISKKCFAGKKLVTIKKQLVTIVIVIVIIVVIVIQMFN